MKQSWNLEQILRSSWTPLAELKEIMLLHDLFSPPHQFNALAAILTHWGGMHSLTVRNDVMLALLAVPLWRRCVVSTLDRSAWTAVSFFVGRDRIGVGALLYRLRGRCHRLLFFKGLIICAMNGLGLILVDVFACLVHGSDF